MPTETDAALRREQRLLVTSTATAAGFAAVGIVWGWWSQSQIILLDGMYALIGLRPGLLSLRAARLVEAGPTPKYPFDLAADLPPQEVEVPGMPTDAARATQGKSSLGDRSHSGRLVGLEERKSSSASMPALSTTHYARCFAATSVR